MIYKALICDVDGTLVPNNANGKISKKVIQAIAKAKEKLHVGVATARPYKIVREITEILSLSGPSVVHSGAQIIDVPTRKIHRQHEFTKESIQQVYAITRKYNVPLYIDETLQTFIASGELPVTTKPILGAYITGITMEKADELIAEYAKIPSVSAFKVPSWSKGKIDISISPLQATKQHGILEVAEILGITTEEIICVGDGYNDFPMLMAAGLKVAMGNAVQELRDIADYIAPRVEEDGVADVIEKFILHAS